MRKVLFQEQNQCNYLNIGRNGLSIWIDQYEKKFRVVSDTGITVLLTPHWDEAVSSLDNQMEMVI